MIRFVTLETPVNEIDRILCRLALVAPGDRSAQGDVAIVDVGLNGVGHARVPVQLPRDRLGDLLVHRDARAR